MLSRTLRAAILSAIFALMSSACHAGTFASNEVFEVNLPAQGSVATRPAEIVINKPVEAAAPKIGRFRAVSAKAAEVVLQAMSLLGTPYRFGGSSPKTGLDCSGLVKYAFQKAIGAVLPRSSSEMSRQGIRVPESEMQTGDLVFYATNRREISHVGIYIGAHRFVHAPSNGGVVRVDRIDDAYWRAHFVGARRLFDGQEEATLPAA
jgi:cell wall-associated NlpC family hydrolase